MVRITAIVTIIAAITSSVVAAATSHSCHVTTTSRLLKMVYTPDAPEPIGAYAQGMIVGGFLYTSGSIPLDPASNSVVAGGMAEQATRALESMRAIIEAAGSNMGKVVKTTVFLSSLVDYETFNAVYADFFGNHRPARSTIQVAGIPEGVMIEIEAVVMQVYSV